MKIPKKETMKRYLALYGRVPFHNPEFGCKICNRIRKYRKLLRKVK